MKAFVSTIDIRPHPGLDRDHRRGNSKGHFLHGQRNLRGGRHVNDHSSNANGGHDQFPIGRGNRGGASAQNRRLGHIRGIDLALGNGFGDSIARDYLHLQPWSMARHDSGIGCAVGDARCFLRPAHSGKGRPGAGTDHGADDGTAPGHGEHLYFGPGQVACRYIRGGGIFRGGRCLPELASFKPGHYCLGNNRNPGGCHCTSYRVVQRGCWNWWQPTESARSFGCFHSKSDRRTVFINRRRGSQRARRPYHPLEGLMGANSRPSLV